MRFMVSAVRARGLNTVGRETGRGDRSSYGERETPPLSIENGP